MIVHLRSYCCFFSTFQQSFHIILAATPVTCNRKIGYTALTYVWQGRNLSQWAPPGVFAHRAFGQLGGLPIKCGHWQACLMIRPACLDRLLGHSLMTEELQLVVACRILICVLKDTVPHPNHSATTFPNHFVCHTIRGTYPQQSHSPL